MIKPEFYFLILAFKKTTFLKCNNRSEGRTVRGKANKCHIHIVKFKTGRISRVFEK